MARDHQTARVSSPAATGERARFSSGMSMPTGSHNSCMAFRRSCGVMQVHFPTEASVGRPVLSSS